MLVLAVCRVMHAQTDARGGGLAGVGVVCVCVCVCRLLTGRRGVCGVFVGASVCAGWAAAWLHSGAACSVGSCAAGYSYAAGCACTAGRMLAPVLQTLAGTLPYMCLLWKCVFPGADWRGGGVVCVVTPLIAPALLARAILSLASSSCSLSVCLSIQETFHCHRSHTGTAYTK